MKAYRAGARTTVSRASLGQLTFLADGGSGRVYQAERCRGDGPPLAFKELTPERAGQVTAAVAFRDELPPADREALDRDCVWPLALVEDGYGAVRGFVMPLIPLSFYAAPGNPGSGPARARPRELAWLAASDAQRTAAGIDLPHTGPGERLALLALLARTIGRLHAHGWVYGDLSLARALFALDPPRLLLTGCDGAVPAAGPPREQASSPWWDPPEGPAQRAPGTRPARQDAATDAYKLGLAVLRCLTPGPGAASSRSAGRAAGALDPAGMSMLARALGADRTQRPAARDWDRYLSRAAVTRGAAAPAVTVSLSGVARPSVPALAAFEAGPWTAALATRPAVTGPGRLPLSWPPVLDLVEDLMPDWAATVTWPRVDDVVARSSGAVAGTVLSETDKYLAALRRAGLGGRE